MVIFFNTAQPVGQHFDAPVERPRKGYDVIALSVGDARAKCELRLLDQGPDPSL
jgi:hypothetical protein